MSVYIDLTEFLARPLLTGIQRVTAEICRWWPTDDLQPVKLTESGQLLELPPALIGAIARCFNDPDGAAVREVCSLRDRPVGAIAVDSDETILVPELFYDQWRVGYYRRMDERLLNRFRFIVYDLMPLLHPEYFAPDIPQDIITSYFSMIRRVPHCGFISKWTQQTYCHRLKRAQETTGVVLRLGSDGLGPRPQTAQKNRPLEFCVVGTIEPRKNHALILDALEPLLFQHPEMKLTFLGKMGWVDPVLGERLKRMAAGECPGFSWVSNADDDSIRRHMQAARASIYVSSAEGFGLPPVESLWLGTPVIASSNLPSLEISGSRGVHIVDPLTPGALREAICLFLNDSFANSKSEEALALELPTWSSFARQTAEWCR